MPFRGTAVDKNTQKQSKLAERISSDVSRGKALRMAARMGIGTAALATGLGAQLGRDLPAAVAASGLPKKKYKFVFVNHATTNLFFTPTIYGIEDACARTGCSYRWTGSQNVLVHEMVVAMQKAIEARVDGIAVAMVDATAFNRPTQDALSAGIPVISYNADTPNQRLAYVGQDLYQSGYNIARKWLPMVKKGGHVLLSGAFLSSGFLQQRIDGYIQAIKDAGNPVTYEVLNAWPDPKQELSRIESYYLSHRNVAGLFGTAATDTLACGQVSKKYGLAAKGVITAGYDTMPETLALVQSGDLTFTTDQQPYLQGFLPILQLYLYKLTAGVVRPFNADTSLAYVTKANVGSYLDVQSRFEGSTNAEPV